MALLRNNIFELSCESIEIKKIIAYALGHELIDEVDSEIAVIYRLL